MGLIKSLDINCESLRYKKYTFNLLIIFILLSPILEGISNEIIPIGTKYLGILVAGIWIIETAFVRRVYFIPLLFLFYSYLIMATLSVFWSIDIKLTLDRVSSLFQVILLYWIVLDVGRSKERLLKLLFSYLFSVMILSLTAIYNIVNDQTYHGLYNRYSAIGYDPNNFGIMVVSSIPIALLYFSKNKIFSLGILYILVAIAIVISTASRGAFLALGFVLIFYIFTSFKSKRRVLLIVTILIASATTIMDYVPEQSLQRLTVAFNDQTAGGRTSAWDLALEGGLQNPYGGIGAGAFYSYSESNGLGVVAHNTFLSNWAEMGFIGISIWILLWLIHFKFSFFPKTRLGEETEIKKAMFGLLVTILLGSLFLNWEVRKQIYIIWGLAACFRNIYSGNLICFNRKSEVSKKSNLNR